MTAVEAEVLKLFRALPYAGFGPCSQEGCKFVGYCRGASPSSRICVECFDVVFDCKAPTRRRRAA